MSRTMTFEVAGGLDAAVAARHRLRARCAWPEGRVEDDVALMLVEVVTNAVRHGGMGPDDVVRIDVTQGPGVARVSVCDSGPGFRPGLREPDPASGGWGLVLVDRLARRWGVSRRRGVNRVWFEVTAP
jgi:anti-sigma regulatory factor (Ser/Thr protein kinase)